MVVFLPKSTEIDETASAQVDPVIGRDAVLLVLPNAGLIFIVLDGIYLGWFTPTQAGAIGALCALLLSLFRRATSIRDFWTVVQVTSEISVTVLMLIVAASVRTKMLAMSTSPSAMVERVMAVVVSLGTPIIGPDVMIWFGIVTAIAVEIGLLTRPFGITVYVVRAALPAGTVSLGDVFVGVAPFVLTMVIVTFILTFVPGLSLIGV